MHGTAQRLVAPAALLAVLLAAPAHAAYLIRFTGTVTALDSPELVAAGIEVGDKTFFQARIDFDGAVDEYPHDPTLFQARAFYGFMASYGQYRVSTGTQGNYVGVDGPTVEALTFSSYLSIATEDDYKRDLARLAMSGEASTTHLESSRRRPICSQLTIRKSCLPYLLMASSPSETSLPGTA